MSMVPLSEVVTLDRKGVHPSEVSPETPYIGLEHIERGGRILPHPQVGDIDLKSSKFYFFPEHILYGKLRPNLGKISRPDFAGICSTDILPLRPHAELDRGYLAHYLSQPEMIRYATSRTTGVNLPRLSPSSLAKFPIPLPPLGEQRRIAAILDQADAIRVKRRKQIEKSDLLLRSIFISMFSDSRNPLVSAGSLFHSFRNGISPSKTGHVKFKVLTLSAITRGYFEGSAVKLGLFENPPVQDKTVNVSDFLICRGNGNKSLVGAGAFPTCSLDDTVFPDTMIAGDVDDRQVDRIFLDVAWKQRMVRDQIESLARTTNGTYKINQKTLASVRISLPMMEQQQSFSRAARKIYLSRESMVAALDRDDELFASLQSRAFRGEL